MSLEPIQIPPPTQEEPPSYGKFFIIAAALLLVSGTAWSLRGTFISSIAKDSKYEALNKDLNTTKRPKNVEVEDFDPWDDMEEIDNLPEEEVRIARRQYEADEKKRQQNKTKASPQAADAAGTPANTSTAPQTQPAANSGAAVRTVPTKQLSKAEQDAVDRDWVTEIFNGPCNGDARPKKCTKLRIKFRCEDRFDERTENRTKQVKRCRSDHKNHLKDIAEK